ncbi:MAG: hypothetical protein NXY57DRAFT_1037680 [Lentinula lateritia]|nr:MAG: hypothetical protein NXY57DRAFT_1037680 [Lentinula lateritia]
MSADDTIKVVQERYHCRQMLSRWYSKDWNKYLRRTLVDLGIMLYRLATAALSFTAKIWYYVVLKELIQNEILPSGVFYAEARPLDREHKKFFHCGDLPIFSQPKG